MTRITAIICTRGRPDSIGNAVRSVLANRHDSFELIVIDQSSDNATGTALEDFSSEPNFRYVHTDRAGLSFAYNHGISLARAPLLAFTDDDCTAPPDWLSNIEAAFAGHPDAEMLYGQTLAAPELAGARGVLPALEIESEEKLGRGLGFRVYGMGANFALRRSLIDRVGGFDEALGGGGPLRSSQDFDFQFRVYRAGAVCLLTPAVWVHHFGIREGREWQTTESAYGIGDGAFYFKHVRCGDLLALRLLLTRTGKILIRELLRPIRRRPSQWRYLRSYLTGMRGSLRFKIDRKTRLYQFTTPRSS